MRFFERAPYSLKLFLENSLDTERLARAFLATAFEMRLDRCEIPFGLKGEIGAGKTTFIKFMFGDMASSPSFTLVNVYDYDLEGEGRLKAYHWDLYRLGGDPDGVLAELELLGFWEMLSDDALTLIEWFDRVEDAEVLKGTPKIVLELSYVDDLADARVGKLTVEPYDLCGLDRLIGVLLEKLNP